MALFELLIKLLLEFFEFARLFTSLETSLGAGFYTRITGGFYTRNRGGFYSIITGGF